MADHIPYIKVFISSPGDVNDERKIALEVIEQLPYQPVFRDKVAFRIVAWDKPGADTSMRATMTPQDAINRGLPKPSECDIVVVLFWSRLGTPFTDREGKNFESGTHWEMLDAIDSERSRDRTVIYRRTEEVLFKATESDKLEQYNRLTTFFESDMFYDSGRIKRGVNQYEKPENFRTKFTSHFQELVLEVLEASGNHPLENSLSDEYPDNENVTTIAPVEWDADNSPFPGLRAFKEDDAPIFFGRGREIDELVGLVEANRFSAVVGASGSGKSSLVSAGLLPRLRINAIEGSKDWLVMRMTPGNEPLVNLYNAMLETFPQFKSNPMEARRIKQNFVADLHESPETLIDICLSGLETAPDWTEVVLYIDQFEELFTLSSEDDKQAIAKLLEAIARSDRVRAIVTMRHDFYHKAIENQTLAELFRGTSFSLSTPKRDALREMIERPAERAGLGFDAGLVDTILDDTGDEPGNLALMAYALDELYKLDDDRHLTQAEYRQLGGVRGAIGVRAHNIFEELDEESKKTVLTSFRYLISIAPDGTPTRKRALLNTFQADEQLAQVINQFIDARLLVAQAEDNTENPTVEVAHEALFSAWQHLSSWIGIAQKDIEVIQEMKRATLAWKRNKYSDAYRWSHERLKDVYRAINILGIDIKTELTKLERAFLEAEQERLYRELEVITTTHQRRYDIGERLSRIGDYREGIGVKDDLPDIAWLPVTGSTGKYKFEFGEFEVPDLFIAKYLITTVQMQTFLDSDWDNSDWWQGFPKRFQQQQFGSVTNGNDNAPRDTVSWYQSVAFGRWLNHQMDGLELSHPSGKTLRVGDNAQIRIPTEWQWQWTAMNGNEKWEYPWGKWDDYARANTTEAGIGKRSMAVGMYPHGIAECKTLDMSGNLWEWCANNYDNPEIIDPADTDSKARRGGAFHDSMDYASCTSRYISSPRSGYYSFGCRLVVSSIIPAFEVR